MVNGAGAWASLCDLSQALADHILRGPYDHLVIVNLFRCVVLRIAFVGSPVLETTFVLIHPCVHSWFYSHMRAYASTIH